MFKFVLVIAAAVVISGVPLNKLQTPPLDWRVIGGSNAPDGAYPYQVSLRTSSGSHDCGGSIIKPTIILTAAHCVVGTSSSHIYVVAGSNKLKEGGIKYGVKDIRSHDDYNPFTVENDIALLKLSSAIEYNDKVSPIELETEHVDAGVEVVLTGWGTTGYPVIHVPNDLQQVTLKTITNSDCQNHHSSKKIFDTQICTLTQRGEGACHGDSGGPLVANGKQNGIVSWGRPCAINYPDVFTRVSSYSEWIKRNSY